MLILNGHHNRVHTLAFAPDGQTLASVAARSKRIHVWDLGRGELAAHADADKVHRVLFGSQLEDDYESGRLTTAAFLAEVRRACGLACADEVIAAAYADIFWPNPDVCALLPRLAARYPLLLLSNTNDLHARRFLAQFEEELRPFQHLVLSHEVGARKPRREIFAHAQRLAGCAAHELVFIDDLPVNVEGALACGWRGIVYTDVEELRRQLAALGIEAM